MSGLPAILSSGTKAFKAEEKGRSTAQVAKRIRVHKVWYLLLALPYIGLLWPPFYTKSEPALFSFPFFYWYQLLWVPLSAVLTGIVYLATRRR